MLALGSGCGWGGRGLEAAPRPPSTTTWEDRVALVRLLCADLGLPPPGPIEVVPTPDDTAGVTFAAMIRLQPEDLDMRTATLLHEVGHLGTPRGREVEEAIADLTRRALLLRWLEIDPATAAPLVPWLLQGLGAGATRADSRPDREPAALYARATRVALALLRATPGDSRSPGASARRYAAAARTGRALTTVEVGALVDRLLRPEDVGAARAAELTGPVLAALRTSAGAPGLRPEVLVLLQALCRILESPVPRWDTFLARPAAPPRTPASLVCCSPFSPNTTARRRARISRPGRVGPAGMATRSAAAPP